MKACSVDSCDRNHSASGLCRTHYERKRKYGDALAGPPIAVKRPPGLSAAEAFRYFLPENCPADECWIWRGPFYQSGYGGFSVGSNSYYAHRFAWELEHGRAPVDGEQVRHTCDNRRCVNPAHLVIGSFSDNMQDAIDRDRFAHSERHWNAKLTQADVLEIRALARSGLTHNSIAERYGRCRSSITNIVNRRQWRHVE